MARPRKSDVLLLFERSAILGAFEPDERERLSGTLYYREYGKDELIFAKGSEGADVLLVVSGRVKIVAVSPKTGSEVILNLIEPGQIFGEIALLDGKPRSADAIAATRTSVLGLYRRDFQAALRRNPHVAETMMNVLCQRLRQATSFAEDAVLLDAKTRLFNRIVALAEQYGAPIEGRAGAIRIEHRLSQREIGESTGLTRVSINRQLAAWREAGLIDDGRGYIVIHDPKALRADVEAGGE